MTSDAQIRPPGYEREVEERRERMKTSILDQDSVTVIDTITLFDPETFRDTMMIVTSNISWRDYMTLRLGIQNPDQLLNGIPFSVTDLQSYRQMVVRWNATETRIDTISRE
jgi:hypothetical protein